jgi:tetratricopeptide (TPR) repeat protein
MLLQSVPGLVYARLGRDTAAVAYYSRLIARAPNFLILNNRGLCYLKLEDWSAAYADFDQALALQPGQYMLLNNRGYAAYKLGRYEEALADLDQSLAIVPDHRRAIANRVLLYTDMQRNEEALRDCNRLLVMHPTAADLLRRSAIYMQMERYEEAVADCAQALKMKPNYHPALYNMACARSLQGEIGTALVLLRQAVEADPICRDAARKDPDLSALHDEPEFRELVGDPE